jgi:hypothetical protein
MEVEGVAFKESRFLEGLDRMPIVGRKEDREAQRAIAGGTHVFSLIGGNHAVGIHRHPVPFDFVLAEAPDLPVQQDAQLIPLDAMRVVVERSVAAALRTLEDVVALARGPVYHFESPPPTSERYLARKPGGRGRGLFPSPAKFVRYKLWRLHSEIVRRHAEQCGVQFVPHPPEAVDEDGFLLPELTANVTHGNAEYGALVVRQMEALVAARAGTRAQIPIRRRNRPSASRASRIDDTRR